MLVKLRQPAINDIAAIKAWGDSNWGISRTNEYLESMFSAIDRLVILPHIGRPRDVIHPGMRSILHRGYVIFYLIEPNGPEIVRIIHEKRNLAALSFAQRFDTDEMP